jgi:hypothetical protein
LHLRADFTGRALLARSVGAGREVGVTIWTLAWAVRRQWPLAVAGMLLTAAGLLWASSVPGVYYQQVRVVFLPPAAPHSPNRYQHLSGSVILTADRVARELGLDPRSPQPVSPLVSIVDQGIRQGSIVRLPNTGGQWAYNYEDPVLDVQVAGPTPAEVRAVSRELVNRIRQRMLTDQVAAGVRPSLRIETTLSPPAPPVLYAHGSAGRAGAAVLVLGLMCTVIGIVLADRSPRWARLRAFPGRLRMNPITRRNGVVTNSELLGGRG